MRFLVIDQWIPTTDSLPPRLEGKDVSEAVLVTLTNPKRVSMLRYNYKNECWCYGPLPAADEVIAWAWAFAPDPYQPESEGTFFTEGPPTPDED